MGKCYLCGKDGELFPKAVQWHNRRSTEKKTCVDCLLDKTSFKCFCEMCESEFFDHQNTSLCYFCRNSVLKNELWRVRTQNARTSVLGLQSDLTLKEWVDTLYKYKMKCFYCKKKDFTSMDHILPVSRGGGTTKDNVIPACSECNSRKYTTY